MKPEPTRCSATSSQTGEPCKRWPIKGGTVCATHGGRSPAVQRKAAKRTETAALARQIKRWGGRLDVSPPEALSELVQTKAAEVAYWQHATNQLDDDQRPNSVVLELLYKAQDQLAAYSAAATRAGLDEELVKVYTLQGGLLLAALRQAVNAARASTQPADDVVRVVLAHMSEHHNNNN